MRSPLHLTLSVPELWVFAPNDEGLLILWPRYLDFFQVDALHGGAKLAFGRRVMGVSQTLKAHLSRII